MRKFFVYCLLLSFVLVLSVPCLAHGGYTFSYVPGLGYVCNDVLPSGLYDFTFYFSNGFYGVGAAPASVSFDTAGSSNSFTVYAELYDPNGVSWGSGSIVMQLKYIAGQTVFANTSDDLLDVVSVVLSLVPTVPSLDVSSLMLAVPGLFSGNFNVQNVLIVVAAAVGLSVGIVLLWFNFHYIKFKLSGALRKGKI